jgi:hypothetical protein
MTWAALVAHGLLQTGSNPYLDPWLNGNFEAAALGPYMSFAALFVGLVAFFIVGGIAVYSRTVVLPAVVAIILLGASAAYLPGLVARSGFLFVSVVAGVLLLLVVRVVG